MPELEFLDRSGLKWRSIPDLFDGTHILVNVDDGEAVSVPPRQDGDNGQANDREPRKPINPSNIGSAALVAEIAQE